MGWLFGLAKILFAIFAIVFVINAVFKFTPRISLLPFAVENGLKVKPLESGDKITAKADSAKEKDKGGKEDESGSMGILPAAPGPQRKPATGGESGTSSDAGKESDEKYVKQGKYFMTFEEINSIENISAADKLTGLSILSKIKKSDLDSILSLVEDGITLAEEEELGRILKRNLSQKDIDRLNEILEKNKKLYSEGKPASKR